MFNPILISLMAIIFSSSAMAQVYHSSASVGTGRSGRASVEAGDSIYLNPATLPHFRGRHLLASAAKDEFAASLSDNTEESALPGAIGYYQKKREISNLTVRQNDFALTLAEFVVNNFTLGLTGHHAESQFNDPVNTSYRQNNADFGLAFVPTQNMGLGAVVYNFLGERKDVPEAVRLRPAAGLGFNYIYQEFVRYRVDLLSAADYNFGKPEAMAGIEAFVGEFFVWRIGFHHESLINRNLTSIGAGFNGPKFAVNYAYEGNTKESGDYRHSIDLQFPF